MCIAVGLCVAGVAYGQSVPEGFSVTQVRNDLGDQSVGFAFLPDGRLLVINHQSGEVTLVADGSLKPEPLLTVPGLLISSEQGLLGIAVDPDYPDSNYVYLFHTRTDSTNRVSRFTLEGALEDPTSENLTLHFDTERTVIAFPDTSRFHNGGTLRFGSDKTLYISHGDDARYYWIQDLTTYYGKILRINRDGTIPDDNPVFPGQPDGVRSEVFAIGLRNPFRFAVDPATDRLFIGDVGTDRFEELNLSTGGENFGYPRYEGEGFFREEEPLIAPEPTVPAFAHAYDRPNSRSVIALATYRQTDFPNDASFPDDYDGVHFYADYFDTTLRTLRPDEAGGWTSEIFGTGFSRLVDGALGPDGSLYLLGYGGVLYRIAYGEPPAVPIADAEAPGGFALGQNYPNPFAGTTTITYTLQAPRHVTLDVYDVLGRRVAALTDAVQPPGVHSARFDAGSLPPGVYVYQLKAGTHTGTKRMIHVHP